MAGIDFLRVHAEAGPERPALILGDRMIDFAALSWRADRAAHVFADLGCEPQDRIAVMSFNSISGSEIANGARRVSAVVVPVNYRLRGAEVGTWTRRRGGADLVRPHPNPGCRSARGRDGAPALGRRHVRPRHRLQLVLLRRRH